MALELVFTLTLLEGKKLREIVLGRRLCSYVMPKLSFLGINSLGISDEDWGRYHQSMVDVRNVRIAHLNVAHAIEVLPNITIAMHCCYLYREWLTEVLHFGNRQGINIKISSDRASDAVKVFENQIREAYIGQ